MTSIFEPEQTAEQREAVLKEFFKEQRESKQERAAAAKLAIPAMTRLAAVMAEKTDQSATLRTFLYSMWNDHDNASLNNIVLLDWPIRKDLLAVLAGFGFESTVAGETFFYDQVKQIILSAGLWDWFTEQAR